MPCEAVVGVSTFSSVLSVVVETNGLDVVSSRVIREEALVVVDVDELVVGSVIGFLLDATVALGRLVVLRVTGVDLTVEALVVGFEVVVVVVEGFGLVSSSDSTENVVTSMSSSETVDGSTFTI